MGKAGTEAVEETETGEVVEGKAREEPENGALNDAEINPWRETGPEAVEKTRAIAREEAE